MGWFSSKKYEYVDGYKVTRDKNKPWICTTHNEWWEDILGPVIWPKTFIDTKHPLWIQHMKDLANSPGAKAVRKEIKKNNRDIKRKSYK